MGILTYEGSRFYMDGEPFLIVSGAIHYFRVPREYWYDRLLKLKECGFNCVETYTCWNLHEPQEGQFDFTGMLDIAAFLQTAQQLGLYVILRPGPYICAEWDLGGLPAWLLADPQIELRCYNEPYLSKVEAYFEKLMQYVRPYLAVNGGNIIMLQVENEYGSYGNDHRYLRAILELYRKLHADCLFFTSDGAAYTMLNGGTLPECLAVANFGSSVAERAKFMKEVRPDQPFMCGEYWNGWFEHWGEAAHHRPMQEIVSDFEEFTKNDWSVNVYMFHGGTNFGFWNGANLMRGQYQPTVTSYDYGALLTEAGDRTEAYYRFREILKEKFGDRVPNSTAKESEKAAYGTVILGESAGLFDHLDRISKPISVVKPNYMEDIGQSFGYVLYRKTLEGPLDGWNLNFDEIRDRVQIFVNGEHRGTQYRNDEVTEEEKVRIPLAFGEKAVLDILAENMGHVNYGPGLTEKKGAVGMRFENQYQFGWQMYPLPMQDLSELVFSKVTEVPPQKSPAFFRGTWEIDGTPKDTFLRLDGWKKGFVTVNGFCLGRYYHIGPTHTLYVPAPMLRDGNNEILVFESDGTDTLTVEFTDLPDLG